MEPLLEITASREACCAPEIPKQLATRRLGSKTESPHRGGFAKEPQCQGQTSRYPGYGNALLCAAKLRLLRLPRYTPSSLPNMCSSMHLRSRSGTPQIDRPVKPTSAAPRLVASSR